MTPFDPGNHVHEDKLEAFVQEVTMALQAGKRHQTPGLGTFSTCTRKATDDRAACTIAMFRASAELREYADGGPPPQVSGPHAQAVSAIVNAMRSDPGADVPNLGRLAIVPAAGKKPKLTFHGAEVLNRALTES